ncbi:hypothetical protein [Sandaracinus amylolyticus]|uniref:hypothetical protein n=1 Tax=Sandaracinus amylolyticus TaxID=927083 RepID=UPI001F295519|nr:hypothetical protein [Sandaracinus amylolyticus]UJR78576.1 Hypothetical protein I5071_6060 [Sandaracinus amylolyticus]
MATKKSTKKSAKKTNSKRTARKSEAAARLSSDEKARMLKPGEDLDEMIETFESGWRAVAKKVKVPGVTPAALAASGRRAAQARAKETALETKLLAKLAPLRDQRMRAGDEAMRLLFKARKIARAVADGDPEVAEAFARFDELFGTRTSES